MSTPPKVPRFRARPIIVRDPKAAAVSKQSDPAPEKAKRRAATARSATPPAPTPVPPVQQTMPDLGDMPFAPAPEDDGFGYLNLVRGRAPEPPPAAEPPKDAAKDAPKDAAKDDAKDDEAEAAIEAIRREPLTARNLRAARRAAQAHGIAAASDHEAIYLLRQRGIDPFTRASLRTVLEQEAAASASTVAGKAGGELGAPPPTANLPQRQVQAQPPAPVAPPGMPAPISEAERARAVMRMQRDIVRRRRRNFLMLMMRLSFFVFLPTVLAGIYYAFIATPIYSTVSAFQIQQSDPVGGLASIGSMFKGSGFATSKDDIAVQAYLQSRDAMKSLDKDLGFKAHFSQPWIDPLQRLPADATDEQTYKLYKRNVKVAYDPTEGLIRMEVLAADPNVSEEFSRALIGLAEKQVNQLTERVRADQMKGSRDSFADAEAKMQAAQDKVIALQKKQGVLDPKVETQIMMTQIADLEKQIRVKQLELDQLMANAQPNMARVEGAKGDIARMQGQVVSLRGQMTEGSDGGESMAEVTGELHFAEAELLTRQQMLAAALQQVETARIEANRQVRYLTTSVEPVAEDAPAYPRVFEDTALAFLIFSGLYLMLSLTASILREQVTS